ncbi:MAG: aspartate--tRNA ligase, partial [Clostridiales bacterium]|nr:aspartate--tRNA ligase [Clostridiales bacterium]
LPFSLDDDENVREDLRLKYRFLDLRRQPMINNLKFRHKVQKVTQDYLDNDGFIYVETPMLMKSTPEGARDYLVPSRVHPGTFYALPQSPQIFKQMLMVGGVDKYYQVARCFRDEDLRADRQPEFTQVDMEMSFVDQEDVLQHLEKLFKYIFKETMGSEIKYDFPRLTWTYCMDVYGSDKPDLRFDLPIVDISDIAKTCSFSVFRKAVDDGGVVRAINIKGGTDFTRTVIENLTEKALSYGAKGMAWIMIRPDGEVYSLLNKFFKQEDIDAIIKAVKAEKGDFILFCADKLKTVRRVLGALRLDVAEIQHLIKDDEYKFLIVTDFPQFEWSDEENRFMAAHHPFTMPYEEDIQYLLTDPGRVRAQAYDVVLNGVELGSGSVRIHRPDVQTKMFEALGFDDEQIESRFGFMVNAFKYGAPPHAGFAFGLDRLVMLLTGAESLREVIAFPKIKDASCPMTGAPDFVDREQLEALNLGQFQDNDEKEGKGKKKKKADIDVDTVANLSKLKLTPDEKKSMKTELSAIIDFADRLAEINTDGVPITAHIVPINNVFREDEVTNKPNRDELLSNAPTKADGYMTVPKTFE